MNFINLAIIVSFFLINNSLVNAQVTIYPFTGVYECKRYNIGGDYVNTTLHVTSLSNSDTIFRILDPDVYGGSWDMGATLHQDSTFDLDYYNCYGRFYGSDSIYLHYYHHYPYGDQYFDYYGRNIGVGIDNYFDQDNPFYVNGQPDNMQIRIINRSFTSKIHCDLFTIAGTQIISQSIHSSPGETNTLFTGHLPGGVYILRLSGGGYVRTGKIVVK